MKTYYVYATIATGCTCDFKVTCGKHFFTVEAENDYDFDIKICEIINEKYTGEFKLNKMLVWTQIPANINLNLLYDELDDTIRLNNIEKQKKRDEEEFRRLKKKLGK